MQRELRSKVAELLGITDRKLPATVEARPITRTDRGSYTEEKLAIDTGEGTQTPLYVLVPKAEPPYKSILVFHGHNPSVHYVLGSYPDEETRVEHLARDINYAQALAQAGYLVCAVEQRGFGERVSDFHGGLERPNSCRHLSFEYLLQGRTLIGERCWDGMLALTYLQRPERSHSGTVRLHRELWRGHHHPMAGRPRRPHLGGGTGLLLLLIQALHPGNLPLRVQLRSGNSPVHGDGRSRSAACPAPATDHRR